MSERVVSAESDLATLGRASCEWKKVGSGREVGSLVGNCCVRYWIRVYLDKRFCGKTESRAGASALTRTVATARGGAML